MSKEEAVARDNARCWAFEELSGAPGEATPIGVARAATSWATVEEAGGVMPGGLFSTPLVRPHGSSLRTGNRSEAGGSLSSSSQDTVQPKLRASSGTGYAAVAANWWRPEFSAYIKTTLENVSELSDDN